MVQGGKLRYNWINLQRKKVTDEREIVFILLLGVTMMFLFGCGKNLEKLAGSGNWQAGRRFKGGASENEVSKWLGTLE